MERRALLDTRGKRDDTKTTPSQTSQKTTISRFLELKSTIGQTLASNITLHINGMKVASLNELDINRFAVDTAPIGSLYQLLHVVEDPAHISQTDHELRALLSNSGKESEAQAALNRVIASYGAVDSSALSVGTFSSARDMVDMNGNVVSAVYPKTGKPDATKTVGNVMIELKPTKGDSDLLTEVDYHALLQSLERVYTVRNTKAYTKRAVCFSVTGRSAWAIVYTQQSDEYELSRAERLDFVRIGHVDVFTMLRALRDYSWDHYWTRDAPLIINTLHTLCVKASDCFVRLVGCSGSAVYGIGLPRRYRHVAGTRTERGVCGSKLDFAIKVFHDRTRFNTEVSTMAAVAGCYMKSNDCSFYAAGAMSVQPNSTIHEPANLTEDAEDNAVTKIIEQLRCFTFWRWDASAVPYHATINVTPTNVPLPGAGSIIMKYGRKITTENTTMATEMAGMLYSLERLHDAGYLHTDLRPSNMLLFDSSVQVTDFDMAVPMPPPSVDTIPGRAVVQVVRGSPRFEYVGERVAKLFLDGYLEVSVFWSRADDIEMALRAILL